jgi:hypothetical protein
MNIITVFAGRKHNIELLKKYLRQALDINIIQEVHFWNNTRNRDDEDYLKSISNLKRSSSTGNGTYIQITPFIINNSFKLNVKAKSDIHIKLINKQIEYEIVLGGYNNTKIIIRRNNNEICCLSQNNIASESILINIDVQIKDGNLIILKNNDLLLTQKIEENFEIEQIYFKTGYSAVGEISYEVTQNKGFYFMDTCEKSWKNYYNYYNNDKYKNDIIIKSDDDIVFIDLHKLPKFIEFVKNNEYDLVFANTINNGVSAYFQQNKYNLIPKDLMDLEYPNNGLCGSLWASGKKAEILHDYFITNYKTFLNYNYNSDIIPINTRFSINFFGFKGKNWHKIINSYINDDEHNLTVDYVKNNNFKNVLYTDFYVSHLSFYRQNETGINISQLITKYNILYNTINFSGRFKS